MFKTLVISICSVEKIEGRPAHGTQAQNNLPSSARWPNSLVSPHLCAVQLPEEFSVLPCAPACLLCCRARERERKEKKKIRLRRGNRVVQRMGDAYAKRVLLTAAGDAVSRGIASTLAKHGCR